MPTAIPVGPADRPARLGRTGIRDPMHAPLMEAARPAALRPLAVTAAHRQRGRAAPRRTPGASAVCGPASRGWAAPGSATPFDSVVGRPRVATPAAGSVAPASSPRSCPTDAAKVRRAPATVLPPVGLQRSIRRSPAAIGAGSAAAAARRRRRPLRARPLRAHRVGAHRPGRRCPVARPLPAQRRPGGRPGAGVRRSAGVASPMTARAVDPHPAADAIDWIAAPSRTTRATGRSASRHRSFPWSVRPLPPTAPPAPSDRSGPTALRAETRPARVRPVEARPARVRPAAVRPARVCPVEARPARVCPAAVRRARAYRVAARRAPVRRAAGLRAPVCRAAGRR
jgi:hypothetical protein